MTGQGWKPHYGSYVECDFCGQLTKGRIYPDAPTKVKCGACNRTIASAVTLPRPPWIEDTEWSNSND